MENTMTEEKKAYTVRVVYKSGYVHDFDVYDFSYKKNATGSVEASWESVDARTPILIGVDEIAAVWVLKELEEC